LQQDGNGVEENPDHGEVAGAYTHAGHDDAEQCEQDALGVHEAGDGLIQFHVGLPLR